MKIALSQLDVTVGDIISNKSKIIDYINKTADCGAELVVFGGVCPILRMSSRPLGVGQRILVINRFEYTDNK